MARKIVIVIEMRQSWNI